MRILYTGGTFDLFHEGHINFLINCKRLADTVVVALNTDEFVSKYKREPVFSYRQREAALLACKYVDRVVTHAHGEDSKPTILSVRPNIIAVGDDWANKDYYKQMGFTQEWLDAKKIVLAYLPYTKGISTTELIEKIKTR